MDRAGSKVLDAGKIKGKICWSIKYMRGAEAKSGRVFVCRVVYGFVQALNAINVIASFVNGRGEPTYLVRV